MGCLKKLPWKFFSKKDQQEISGFIKITHDSKKPVEPIAKLSVKNILSNTFLRIINLPKINDQILKYLNPQEKSNLYQATYELSAIFRFLVFEKLDASFSAFANRETENLLKAIDRHNPPRISFPLPATFADLSVVYVILKRCIDKNAQERVTKFMRVKELDLSRVIVNETLVKLMADKFIIEELKLGNAKQHIEKYFKIEGLKKLQMNGNNNFLATSLKVEVFDKLQELNFVNCKRLSLVDLGKFVSESNTLQQLKIIDCILTDRDSYLLHFTEIIFSEKSR